MRTAFVRVYEELNEFLPPEKRKRRFACPVRDAATISGLLECLGIPASKVDLILAGDVSAGLDHEIRDRENVSLFPVFEAFDIAETTKLRNHPLRSTRFIAGRSLSRLAACLRRGGFDVACSETDTVSPEFLQRAEAEQLILLTNNEHEATSAAISRILIVKRSSPREQMRQVLTRLQLYRSAAHNSWNVTPDEACAIQERLRHEVVIHDDAGEVKLVGGVDVAFDEKDRIARAAIAVLSLPGLELLESAVATLPLHFPYVPGLLSFRETPAVLMALSRLHELPDLLFCDGHGLAHPRRFGMACHVGLLSGIASIGVAKSLLIGEHGELKQDRGAWMHLVDGHEKVGAVVRTRARVKPVYVSVGSGVSLETAIDYVLCSSRFRLPEPSRWADRISRNPESGLEHTRRRY